MKRIIIALTIAIIVLASAQSYFTYVSANRDFTPWMSELELSLYVQKFDDTKPGQPDWKKSHWITAAEGRWYDGVAEYRIRTAEAPKGVEFAWFWFVDMDQAAFSKNIQDYSEKSYGLVYSNSYKLPDGTTRYQGVWHKPAH